ncbi:hypothetical protein BD410DRAFT_775314 [Rickenella mellea]|uniref:Uncharacterized protein n=1 Tax=Rickenella mellea TaxID=50990 RepID=A0A4Y7PU60_9AGAM|nr:hypothetical protein BD410DRAFT_775314 [Rickenella mellea]
MGGCGSNFTINRTDGCSHNSLAIPVNLYLNKNASTPVNQSTPMLQYDPSDILTPPAAQYIPGRSSLPPTVFETDLTIDPFLPYTLFKKQSNLYYPFDQINSYVSLLAINPLTNETIPIASVIGYGTTVNWIGFAIFGTAPPLPGSDVAQFYATLSSHRQRLVKGVVIIIVITNWLLSLAILYMTILVILQRQVNTQLLLASTSVLFAIPQIRASMPDAPPFGAYLLLCQDTGGYFINLCLVSACVRFPLQS